MNRHGEAPPSDWSLSDLSDEDCERIAERLEGLEMPTARRGDYEAAEALTLAARIVREWAEQRERELRYQQQMNEVFNSGDGAYRP